LLCKFVWYSFKLILNLDYYPSLLGPFKGAIEFSILSKILVCLLHAFKSLLSLLLLTKLLVFFLFSFFLFFFFIFFICLREKDNLREPKIGLWQCVFDESLSHLKCMNNSKMKLKYKLERVLRYFDLIKMVNT
jgi:hypothetical protein